ncbi:hypothetical protein ACFSHP_17335 [Novosphingobium panipatense]
MRGIPAIGIADRSIPVMAMEIARAQNGTIAIIPRPSATRLAVKAKLRACRSASTMCAIASITGRSAVTRSRIRAMR